MIRLAVPVLAGIILSTGLAAGPTGARAADPSKLDGQKAGPDEPLKDALDFLRAYSSLGPPGLLDDDLLPPRSVRRFLLQPVAWDKNIPSNTSLSAALSIISAHHGAITIDTKSLQRLRAPLARKMPVGELAGCETPLLWAVDILVDGLERTKGYTVLANGRRPDRPVRQRRSHYPVIYRIQPNGIEVTAVRPDSPERDEFNRLFEVLPRRDRLAVQQFVRVARSLDQRVPHIEANARLASVLEFLADDLDLTLIIDTNALAAVGLKNVEDRRIALGPQENAKIATILSTLFDELEEGDWTPDFLIRRDYVEITPQHKNIRQKGPLTAEQLSRLWQGLASDNKFLRQLVAETLVQFPAQAVGLFGEQFKQEPQPDRKKVAEAARWIKDLESADFSSRQGATEELVKLGNAARVALRQRLKQQPSLELSKRAEQILLRLLPGRHRVRDFLAIRVLEAIGTFEVEGLLENIAEGEFGSAQGDWAKEALERLRN
jgi:hypothetical protein